MATRNTRIIYSVVALFVIFTFFASTQTSFDDSLHRFPKPVAKGQSDSSIDETNTFQGTPYKGKEPPYSKQGKKNRPEAGAGRGAPKVVADKSTGKSKGPQKDTDADTDVGHNEKNIEADSCSSEKYVVMIDAGSTGSRVHIYRFDTCLSPPMLLNEDFKMLNPGLSSFDTDAEGAAASLDPLLDFAKEKIPANAQSCTPVAVKATAGLRILGAEKSDKILESVKKHLENDYPFAVVQGDGVAIMDGKDEGVYAWITANFLLGKIGNAGVTETAAVFDLGGGSTQIVFEPEFGENEKMVEGEHKHSFSFGDRKFTLYQFSHLGYGLMEGRNKVNGLVVKASLKGNTELQDSKVLSASILKDKEATITLNNPCVPPGMVAKNVQVKLDDKEFYLVNMKGPSEEAASGARCRFLAEQVLNKDAECPQKPCSFNGVHQPSLVKAFSKSSDMYIFSYFYDRTNPLGFPSSFTLEELNDLAKLVCRGDKFWSEVLLDDHVKELNEEPLWCLDLSFISAMLHTGYDIPLHRELRTAKKIDNNELGWCLGASLPLLDSKASNWKCKIEKVQ